MGAPPHQVTPLVGGPAASTVEPADSEVYAASVLVGRDSERRLISEMLAAARVGDSRVLVLSGEPGIGKTALLRAAESLVGDMQVLRAQGVESEQYLPFAGLLQLLRPVLGLVDEIPEPQSRALSSALLLGPAPRGDVSRFAVGAATVGLLSRAAEDRPLAVFVDDGHLLDAPSAEAVVFAARRLFSDPVAVLVAVRDSAPGAEVWTSLPTRSLVGLDLDAAAELVGGSSRWVRRDLLPHVHSATGGNPLALIELAGLLDEPPIAGAPVTLPDRLTSAFMERVGRLSAGAGSALLVAAADSTSLTAVHAACLELGTTSAALAEAQDAELIRIHGDQVDFRHPLVRSAVYTAANADDRRRAHRALARALPKGQADRRAWHLSQAAGGPDAETASALEAAGQQAAARGAHAIATQAFDRAATLTVTRELVAPRLTAAANAAWLAGETDRATALLDRALAHEPEPLQRARIQELRGAVETRAGSLDVALTTLTQAAQEIRTTDVDTAIRLYADVIHVAFYRFAPKAAADAAGAIEALLPESSDAETRSLGSMASGMALVLNGAGAPGVERLRDTAYDLVTTEAGARDRLRLPLRIQGALWLRDSGPQRQLVADAVERLRDQAALGSLPYLLMHIARDGATTDRWDDAESAYQEAIRLARETGQSTDLAVSLAGRACLHARRGEADDCRADAREAAALAQANQVALAALWSRFALGDLSSGLGDVAAAITHYESAEELLAETGMADPDQSCAPELVESYLQVGRTEDAARVAEAFSHRAAAKGQPWSSARASRTLGLSTPGDDGARWFRTALELHARTPDRFEAARTELAFGARLRRERRRVDARPLLRAALESFEVLGARPWADRAAQELDATGETAVRRQLGAREQLTPQERQIAQLLAEGRTTRETAAALFLSPKTVEYHLRHVYQKLGIRSRDALAERFPSAP